MDSQYLQYYPLPAAHLWIWPGSGFWVKRCSPCNNHWKGNRRFVSAIPAVHPQRAINFLPEAAEAGKRASNPDYQNRKYRHCSVFGKLCQLDIFSAADGRFWRGRYGGIPGGHTLAYI